VNDGRANRRDKPTVGDRPRAPSPTLLPTSSHVPVLSRRDNDEEDTATGDDNDDDDDDWDEIRSF